MEHDTSKISENLNFFKRYFYCKKLGKYKAQLKLVSIPLQKKENFLAIKKLVNAAQKTLLFYKENQKLDNAWNQYHNTNIDSISYMPHEKEFLEAMVTMHSAEDGWKLADDMLNFRKEIEIPWYARGLLLNNKKYVTSLFLIISILLIATTLLVLSWELVVGVIAVLFGCFLSESDSDSLH